MAGINFNSNSFQLRTTSLKKANVAPEAQKKEEEVKAGSEEKKPVIKTKIQNSSLNLLGNYNMVSVNTTAKKGTLKAAGVKPSIVNNDNQGDKKVENDVEKQLDYSKMFKDWFGHIGGPVPGYNAGDWSIGELNNGTYRVILYTGNGFKAIVSNSEDAALEWARKNGAKD